jgi:uncharacterized membrane protein
MTDAQLTPPRKRRITRFLLTGLATLLPVVLTGYIIVAVYRFVDKNLGQWLARAIEASLKPFVADIAWTHPVVRGAGNVVAVGVVLLASISVGALAGSLIGRRIIRVGEHLFLKVPFIRVIYPYVKQVTDFVLSEKKITFRKVVAVPYPRKEVYSLGFVTGHGWRSINEASGEEMVQVFIPSSPTPVTGYVVFVPRGEVIELPITVDEALRFSISAGVIVPPKELVADAVPAIEPPAPDQPVRPHAPAWADEDG